MKKHTKQILGFLGLTGVVAMTSIAAMIPAPGASAITSSVTDTIEVRVIGGEPEIIMSATDPEQITEPDYNFKITYEHISDLKVTAVRKDAEGNIVDQIIIFEKNDLNYEPGEQSFPLDLDLLGGVGYYTFTALGHGYNGVPVERILAVTYTNVEAEVEPGEDGEIVIEIEPTDDTKKIVIDVVDDEGEVIRHIVINPETGDVEIYDKDWKLIEVIPHGYVDGKLVVPLDGLDTGNYELIIKYLDGDGNIIGVPATTSVQYTAKPLPIPDTGAFFKNLNISKQDYLITGLIIFFVFGVVALGIVARNRSNKSKINKKR